MRAENQALAAARLQQILKSSIEVPDLGAQLSVILLYGLKKGVLVIADDCVMGQALKLAGNVNEKSPLLFRGPGFAEPP